MVQFIGGMIVDLISFLIGVFIAATGRTLLKLFAVDEPSDIQSVVVGLAFWGFVAMLAYATL
ncbi:hypothetical protein JQ612_18935 [Bradyrhizobium manausense]|uniref:hypothetical protein n=1 Tax=Bradyrhizobium manausense TaxID=989370 RepID=UPI001BA7FE9A|nr:hypothetical protein [Bradyrhizobium manausense]MBR0690001.1 hypothetical protein [Bradyrhizobium manausense]MBR0721113.1 hypothetical protein [Bradyrhizobium manausense]MBR0835266.1 hypothetical protein [Bradyrhizobium manausense]